MSSEGVEAEGKCVLRDMQHQSCNHQTQQGLRSLCIADQLSILNIQHANTASPVLS